MRNILFAIICLLLLSACKVKKINWPSALKNQQRSDKLISKYLIDLTYRNRLNMEKLGVLSSFDQSDTLYIIDKINIQSSNAGYSYVWDNNRNKGLVYFDTISDEARRSGNLGIVNAYYLNFRNISYSEIDTVLKFKVENFDTVNIEKNQILDGYAVVISRIIKGGKIESYYFSE